MAWSFLAEDAGRVLTAKLAPLQKQWLAEFDALAQLQQQKKTEAMDATALALHQRKMVTLGIIALLILGGVAFAVSLTSSITLPLKAAIAYAERVAQGDLSTRVQVHVKDEASAVPAAFERMSVQLADLVRAVRASVESISTASSEIASGNQDLSSRTETRAASLQQTAASMQHITAAVRKSAQNARMADSLAQQAAQVADQGGSVMQQVEATMSAINGSSRKVVDIISVIDGIAFQTNILALNAAVEAARAGEKGRGFAVVAGEVRTLVQRSAAAAREIKTLITESVEKVEQGGAMVGSASETLRAMVQRVVSLKQVIGEISVASGEQRDGVEQVNVAVTTMDQGTQQNAALVEEAAAAAMSLQQLAQRLSGLVTVFRVSDQPQSA